MPHWICPIENSFPTIDFHLRLQGCCLGEGGFWRNKWPDNLPSSPTCVRMNDIYPSLFAGFVNGGGSADFHVFTTSTVGRKFAQTNSQIHYGTCESNNSKLCVICVKWETSPSNQRWRLVKYWIIAPGSIFHYFYHFRFRVNKMDEWLKFTTSIPLFSIVRHIRQSCG